MFSLPDWAPGVHPMIVHFPIALFFLAVLADLVALVLSRYGLLRQVAAGLYALGAVSALVAFFTGRAAADGVLLPAAANPVLTDHADWAEWTVWYYGLFALARVFVAWWDRRGRWSLHLALFIIGAGGLFLVYETGEHGAQMVFQYGAGVQAVEKSEMEAHDHSHHEAEAGETHDHSHHETEAEEAHGEAGHTHAEPAPEAHAHAEGSGEAPAVSEQGGGFRTEEGGAWSWDVGHDDHEVLHSRFEWLEGFRSDLSPAPVHDEEMGDVLALRAEGGRAMFVAGSPLRSVQFDLRLNRDRFDGKVRLVHHVQSRSDYNFMELEGEKVCLGRLVGGVEKIEDEGSTGATGWISVRVVGDGTHFRGYVGKQMVAHGHGAEPAPGKVGLLVQGTGTLLLDGFKVEALRAK